MNALPPTARVGRRLKVAWVGPYDIEGLSHRVPGISGGPFHAATWLRNAARGLAKRGDVELHVLTHDRRFPGDCSFEDGGVHFHLFRAPVPAIPRPLVLYQLDRWKYYRALRRLAPDVVHGHGTENAFSYVAVTSGFPHVISIQAIIRDLLRQYTRLSRRMLEHVIVRHIEQYTVRRADNVVIKAPFAEEFVRSLNSKARIFLVENIVHEAYFGVERDAAAPRSSILFVGTLVQTKGVEDLVRAFHAVAPQHPGATLDLVGTGTEAYVSRILRPLIRAGAGAGRIRLHGRRDATQIAGHFRDAAMLVLPSYCDTSPNVVAEAMVAGVPVIGTDVGGIPFMIRQGETGQIVPPRDRAALAEAMSLYLRDTGRAREHAERARREARERWTESRCVDRLMTIYRELANGSRKTT